MCTHDVHRRVYRGVLRLAVLRALVAAPGPVPVVPFVRAIFDGLALASSRGGQHERRGGRGSRVVAASERVAHDLHERREHEAVDPRRDLVGGPLALLPPRHGRRGCRLLGLRLRL